MVDLSRLMQDAAILEVIDKSADEASSLSAQNSYQAMKIEELERAHAAALEELATLKADQAVYSKHVADTIAKWAAEKINLERELASLRGDSK